LIQSPHVGRSGNSGFDFEDPELLSDFLGWYPFQLEPSSINDVDQHQSPTDLRRRAQAVRGSTTSWPDSVVAAPD
jgi:hypothetical protein